MVRADNPVFTKSSQLPSATLNFSACYAAPTHTRNRHPCTLNPNTGVERP